MKTLILALAFLLLASTSHAGQYRFYSPSGTFYGQYGPGGGTVYDSNGNFGYWRTGGYRPYRSYQYEGPTYFYRPMHWDAPGYYTGGYYVPW